MASLGRGRERRSTVGPMQIAYLGRILRVRRQTLPVSRRSAKPIPLSPALATRPRSASPPLLTAARGRH